MYKYKKCKFCGDTIEIHHITPHQDRCFLRPANLKKICDYLKNGIIDNRLLRRATFYRWAMENNVLTSITITTRLQSKNWQEALYQLLIYGYLDGYIDFEYVEVLLSIITYETMWLEEKQWKKVREEITTDALLSRGIEKHELYHNLAMLVTYVVTRCNDDMSLDDGSIDENRDTVNLADAVDFMMEFAPEVVQHRLKKGLYSDDSVRLIESYTGH